MIATQWRTLKTKNQGGGPEFMGRVKGAACGEGPGKVVGSRGQRTDFLIMNLELLLDFFEQ